MADKRDEIPTEKEGEEKRGKRIRAHSCSLKKGY
jgi:hypothetical protein